MDPTERFHLGAGGDIASARWTAGAHRQRHARPDRRAAQGRQDHAAGADRPAICAERPAARIVVLLIDERPEEVTYFRRTVAAEVFASSSDQGPAEHTALAELLLAHIRTELECGSDIVVLLDSLTRLARAFNLSSSGAGRSLSGGMDAAALEIPRRFFGLARNVENGGSVTMLATVLVATGSRMDEVIFEEFKSTGNSEIVLDRGLAQEQLFPAIDVHRTGTRKEERLYSAAEMAHGRAAAHPGRLPAPPGAGTTAETAGAVSDQRRAAASFSADQIRRGLIGASHHLNELSFGRGQRFHLADAEVFIGRQEAQPYGNRQAHQLPRMHPAEVRATFDDISAAQRAGREHLLEGAGEPPGDAPAHVGSAG